MNNTNGVLTQGSQVETSKTRVRPIGGDIGFFPESFEANEEIITPTPDFINRAFEPQELDPTTTSVSSLQIPGSIDFNTPKDTQVNEILVPTAFTNAFASEEDHHLDPTTSKFATLQTITESPVKMLGGTTEKLAEGAGRVMETVGSVAEAGSKTLGEAGNTIIKDLILEEMFGIKLNAPKPANTDRPLSEKEQEALTTGQFVKFRGEELQAKLSQAAQETQVKIAVGMIGKPELTEEDLAMLGENPNLRKEKRDNIYNLAVYRGKIAEQQKKIDQAELTAKDRQVQGAGGQGLVQGEGELSKGTENRNHFTTSVN